MKSERTLVKARAGYALAALAVVALGLAWRSPLLPLSPFLKKYGADALWALMVFLLVRFARPQSGLWLSAWIAFGISAVVEFSQLYHAAWIDSIRAMRLGALVLGSVFNWPDLPAYALGIVAGALLERRFWLQRPAP